ncbi:hypothetical protein PS467_01640 [Streptomyces luomodiensis]|uniref:Uncharacterized protein n=1 Tax=Streptomyces luomodiensis TaxID=3026192 RepID=A0ABY9UNQ4_9ACTN|nr:hypothetical protein [Streptomyces sp. SCA4-21]WNE94111.1 hypothetical protein PS467_01640 [Streptomyces sp. SCA4-21]
MSFGGQAAAAEDQDVEVDVRPLLRGTDHCQVVPVRALRGDSGAGGTGADADGGAALAG